MKVLSLAVVVNCIVLSLCEPPAISLLPKDSSKQQLNYLLKPLASNFKSSKLPVTFWLDNTVDSAYGFTHRDTLNAVLLRYNDWMLVTVHNSTQCVHPTPLQSVMMASTYRSMTQFVLSMAYECFNPSGYYIFTVAEQWQSGERGIRDVFQTLWKMRILNAAFIVPMMAGRAYQAYGYVPNVESKCGSVQLKLLDSYTLNRWQHPDRWFRIGALPNFQHCPLKVATFESKPYVLLRNRTNGTFAFVGLEVNILRIIAAKLNFSYEFVTPAGNSKWGVLLPSNSTGLMGMLQRSEVDVGFGAVGRSLERNFYLRSSFPSVMTQLSMAIPPKRPYTSLEKLFRPFSLPAWLLVAGGYSTISALYVLVFHVRSNPYFEHIPGIFYTIWTILMGGPGCEVRRNSSRLYVVSLVLNALIVRNLYQSALFQYLKSNDPMAANLHTYEDINAARLSYYMYESTSIFFRENPHVNNTIRLVTDENIDSDGIMYNISQHRLQGVISLPLECISYYVKHRGSQGMVYVSERTGISFFIAFHFPKMSALEEPFNRLLLRLHGGGFLVLWMRNFRHNPHTWANYEQNHTPTPLHLHQVSGGFYLWAVESHNNESTGWDQQHVLNTVLQLNSQWLSGTITSRLESITYAMYNSYYMMFYAASYDSMIMVLETLTYRQYDSSGRCMLVLDCEYNALFLRQIFNLLWKLRIVNVALIVREPEEGYYRAYNYNPYRENKCEVIEPILVDSYRAGQWDELWRWFPDHLNNFHRCTLKAGTFHAKPYSMPLGEDSKTGRTGMEAVLVQNLAVWFNFSLEYRWPSSKVKWGMIRAANSTGLVGMIQRGEVDFGFGSLGINVHRNQYLKMGHPSIISQLNVAIPADRPYTWLEKLYHPFTVDAWLCIILGYAAFAAVTLLVFDSKFITTPEHFRNPVYNLWELLMGGPSGTFRRTSARLFITGFVLNALVVRTMYQSALFQRLQASTRLGTKLNTFQHINEANLFYYMYITTSLYYQDNPLLRGRIRILYDESKDWDEIMYDISQYKLNGVFAIPVDCIEYYVKNNGKRGIVYVGRHTGINYILALYYPKASPLTKPFDRMISRYQAAGLLHTCKERFRDTRYWTGTKSHPEPASLKWQHVSGAFYLWAILLGFSLAALFGEVTMHGNRE
uniref:Ionotropic glutamate receptor L-glutamate and glycine-binding domain-containing protein n=1 Tax=Anopheles farauti TaxID=69004 RepID=A0A182QN94_9DIPT